YMVAWGRVIMSMAATAYRPVKLIGLGCLVVTAFGWGLNWPATKFLLEQCPPLTARGIAGLVAALALAGIAAARGENLAVPPGLRLRLVASALLNVSAWMGLTTLSLLWLNAGEAATLAYTMPVWAALLAWPILGEQLGLNRVAALLLGISGIAVLLGGNVFHAETDKLPGIAIALAAAMLFALGTVLSKRWPLVMDPIAMTAWQVGIGCTVLLAASLVLEHPHLLEMHWFGWVALTYTAVVSLGICYLMWFAALRRLEASTAAIGTLLTPIVGVLASAIALGEPLMFPQFASLALVVSGIVLAVRQ
ncbi:MAG: DMT family transporter, partial [Acetobacteraceae bacterium]